jgi:hypothetical protein
LRATRPPRHLQPSVEQRCALNVHALALGLLALEPLGDLTLAEDHVRIATCRETCAARLVVYGLLRALRAPRWQKQHTLVDDRLRLHGARRRLRLLALHPPLVLGAQLPLRLLRVGLQLQQRLGALAMRGLRRGLRRGLALLHRPARLANAHV